MIYANSLLTNHQNMILLANLIPFKDYYILDFWIKLPIKLNHLLWHISLIINPV